MLRYDIAMLTAPHRLPFASVESRQLLVAPCLDRRAEASAVSPLPTQAPELLKTSIRHLMHRLIVSCILLLGIVAEGAWLVLLGRWLLALLLLMAASLSNEEPDKSNATVAASSPAQQTYSGQSKATDSSTDQTGSLKAHDAPVGGCMPIGITIQGNLVFSMVCRELLRGAYASLESLPEPTPAVPREQAARVGHDRQTVGSVRDHETVGSAREHEPKSVAAGVSVDDQNAVNLPSKGSDVRAGVNPIPRAKVKLATDSSRTIVENAHKRTNVRQFSRTDWRRQKRFAELLNDPLAFNCMNCLLFGY
jgi:hypothetical protein